MLILKLPPQLRTFSHFLISASVLGVCHLKIPTCCLTMFLKIKKENNYYISCYSTNSAVSVTELASLVTEPKKNILRFKQSKFTVWVIDSLFQLFHLFFLVKYYGNIKNFILTSLLSLLLSHP